MSNYDLNKIDLEITGEERIDNLMENITHLGFRFYTNKQGRGSANPKYYKLCNQQNEVIKKFQFEVHPDIFGQPEEWENAEIEVLQQIYNWAQNYKLKQTNDKIEKSNKEANIL